MMRTIPTKIGVIILALAFSAGAVLAQGICPPAAIKGDLEPMISRAYCLFLNNQLRAAQAELEKVLQKDPGNPVALNNLAAIMVKEKKFDKADTYLEQALPRARGYMVQVNRVCAVNEICIALEPLKMGGGNQALEPLIKMNLEMVKGMMAATPIPGKGLR